MSPWVSDPEERKDLCLTLIYCGKVNRRRNSGLLWGHGTGHGFSELSEKAAVASALDVSSEDFGELVRNKRKTILVGKVQLGVIYPP